MSKPARRPSPIEAGELPHFIFRRARPAEKAYGFTLAGVLLTDIPSDRELSERDRQLIFDIIQALNDAAAADPNWNEAGLWRRRAMPPGGVEAPFSHAMIRARAKGCRAMVVRDDGFCRIDDSQLAEVMGWDEPAERTN
jgi:hypothetical protein